MADVIAALLHELLAFAHARASTIASSALADASTLADALHTGAPTDDLALRLQQFRDAIAAGDVAVQPAVVAVQGFATDATGAVQQLATELAAANFDLPAAERAGVQLAKAAAALDAAIASIAAAVGDMADPVVANRRPDVRDAIVGIKEPWVSALRGLGGAGSSFDALALQLLGIPGAASQLASRFVRDTAAGEIAFAYSAVGERAPVAAMPVFTVDEASLTAFVRFGADPAVGVRANAVIRTGLRSDGLLEQIIPASAPSAKGEATTIQLDTARGLSLGSGFSPRVMLPFEFSLPGIQVHDVALAVGSSAAGDAQLELTTTIAGSLGGVMSMLVEGGGVRIGLVASAGAGVLPITVTPRFPDAAGVTVDAGIVRGGGYLYHKNNEYGGVLDLRLGTIAITAIGFVGTNPFSLVIVIGVQFMPAIELSFGFTLNGVGGLLAVQRRIDSGALRRAIVGHSADTILFPDDPVANAPKILDTLHEIFPFQEGGFVIGPIAKLGWGSQAKLVTAKLGIALSLPDPKLVLLGSFRVAVPSVEVPRELCIVDLNAELYGELTVDYFVLIVGLTDSKVAEYVISGDVGLLVAWGSSPEIAISIGGFHPHYTPPALLTGLRRIAIDISPAVFVTLHAEGYLAITSNTVQFGAQVRLIADIGIASGEAWVGLDALFRWAPTFHFEVDVSAGLALKVLGHTFAGVDFSGHLEGVTPWRLQGTATLDVWFLPTVHFDVGPFEWGSTNPDVPASVSPLQIVVDALASGDAWRPQLPGGFDAVVRLIKDDVTPLLVHPLGALEVKQIKVPLETAIERVGRSPVTAHRVNFANPKVGALPAAAVSHVTERFAPADFLTLTDDQRLSRQSFEEFPAGARIAASAAPTNGPGVDALYEWETIFPHEPALGSKRYGQKFNGMAAVALRSGAVAKAARQRANPYLSTPDPVELSNPGQVEIRRRDDLAAVAGAAGLMTTTAASHLVSTLVDAGAESNAFELVSAGVLA
ncbi:MAG: DUF6603 domain-containing protein [bacterium]